MGDQVQIILEESGFYGSQILEFLCKIMGIVMTEMPETIEKSEWNWHMEWKVMKAKILRKTQVLPSHEETLFSSVGDGSDWRKLYDSGQTKRN